MSTNKIQKPEKRDVLGNHHNQVMPSVGRLDADLSRWKPGFDIGPVHLGFVVDDVALEQACL